MQNLLAIEHTTDIIPTVVVSPIGKSAHRVLIQAKLFDDVFGTSSGSVNALAANIKNHENAIIAAILETFNGGKAKLNSVPILESHELHSLTK